MLSIFIHICTYALQTYNFYIRTHASMHDANLLWSIYFYSFFFLCFSFLLLLICTLFFIFLTFCMCMHADDDWVMWVVFSSFFLSYSFILFLHSFPFLLIFFIIRMHIQNIFLSPFVLLLFLFYLYLDFFYIFKLVSTPFHHSMIVYY